MQINGVGLFKVDIVKTDEFLIRVRRKIDETALCIRLIQPFPGHKYLRTGEFCNVTDHVGKHAGAVRCRFAFAVMPVDPGVVPAVQEKDLTFAQFPPEQKRLESFLINDQRFHLRIGDLKFAQLTVKHAVAVPFHRLSKIVVGVIVDCAPVKTRTASFDFDAAKFGKVAAVHQIIYRIVGVIPGDVFGELGQADEKDPVKIASKDALLSSGTTDFAVTIARFITLPILRASITGIYSLNSGSKERL